MYAYVHILQRVVVAGRSRRGRMDSKDTRTAGGTDGPCPSDADDRPGDLGAAKPTKVRRTVASTFDRHLMSLPLDADIVEWLAKMGLEVFPASVYGLAAIPHRLIVSDIFWVVGLVFVFGLLASFLPALCASLKDPVRALNQ